MTRCTITLVALAMTLGLEGAAATESESATARTVLVELFTSQGCSSCPAADRVLTELGAEGARGIEIIPLSFHVDYWNYIGWTDPFSSEAWSHRQSRYAAHFASDRVYTPQVVVDGQSECVGAYRRDVIRHVQRAARRPVQGVLEITLDTAAELPRLGVVASVDAKATGTVDVLVALFETGLTTEVGSGENARRTLHNDYVVRRLIPLARLAPGETHEGDRTLDLDPLWKRENLGVAVFLQSPETYEVYRASSVRF